MHTATNGSEARSVAMSRASLSILDHHKKTTATNIRKFLTTYSVITTLIKNGLLVDCEHRKNG